MKTLLFIFALTLSLTSQAQQLLTYKVNAKVQLSSGDSIATGAVFSFAAHFDNIATTGKIACDVMTWVNDSAKVRNYDNVIACTSTSNRMGTRLTSHYISVADPEAVSYSSIRAALKTWLESIYGNNVTIIE